MNEAGHENKNRGKKHPKRKYYHPPSPSRNILPPLNFTIHTYYTIAMAFLSSLLVLSQNSRGVLGFALVGSFHSSRRYSTTTGSIYSRCTNNNLQSIRKSQTNRRIRTCRLSSVSPEASPTSSSSIINATQRQQQQQQQQQIRMKSTTTTHPILRREYTIDSLEQERNVWTRFCDIQVPEGQVVGLELRDFAEDDPDAVEPQQISLTSNATGDHHHHHHHHWIYSVLHPDEIAYAMQQSSKVSRESFCIGRIAIRQAFERLGRRQDHDEHILHNTDDSYQNGNNNSSSSSKNNISICTGVQSISPILKDRYGRPTVPKGYVGSISHKGRAAVGIIASDDTTTTTTTTSRCCYSPGDTTPTFGIGVDLERTSNSRRNIARRVLTQREIASLGKLPNVTEEEEIMLRFSLKECIYKAVHPLICQYVGFQEAEVTPHSDGTASVKWMLKTKGGAEHRIGKITAHWQRLEGGKYFLSTSSASIKIVES